MGSSSVSSFSPENFETEDCEEHPEVNSHEGIQYNFLHKPNDLKVLKKDTETGENNDGDEGPLLESFLTGSQPNKT
jgi:hypothetical protein